MMKRILLATAALLVAQTLMAGPVDGTRARIVAKNAVRLHALYMDNADKQIAAEAPVSLQTVSLASPLENLYIYNYAMPMNQGGDSLKGFVVLSGDDMAAPVLAISDEAPLDPTDVNPAARFWLEQYDKQIAAGRKSNMASTREIARKWDLLQNGSALKLALDSFAQKGDFYNDHIPLLIRSRWSQEKPYNNLCPRNAVTGCVATAFAMIMRYWEYPEHGFGRHSYNGADNPAAYPDWSYGELSADFENTYYDWGHMPEFIQLNSDPTEINAIATLIYHVGVAIDMRYGENGSMSWSLPEYAIYDTSLHLDPTISAPYRISKHFGYKYSYTGMRDSIGDDTLWMKMVYNSLADGKPVYYAGWAKDDSPDGHSGTSGHGFLIVGYFSDVVDSNLYSVNWGWGGNSNGYFKLDALRPGTNDFTQWHGAVLGMEPDTSYHGYDPSAIPITESSALHAYVMGNSIVAHGLNGKSATLFDIMGRRVAYRSANQGDTWNVTVKPGIYIVRIGQQSGQKLVVLQ